MSLTDYTVPGVLTQLLEITKSLETNAVLANELAALAVSIPAPLKEHIFPLVFHCGKKEFTCSIYIAEACYEKKLSRPLSQKQPRKPITNKGKGEHKEQVKRGKHGESVKVKRKV